MRNDGSVVRPDKGTLLGALRRDRRGNTLAIMAIALIPLSALVGSGVDTARVYVVKARLQQACDAGVLAGRKFMASDGNSALDSVSATRANEFFSNNFKTGWLSTPATGMAGAATFTSRKTADSQVAGTASVTVPMTIMKMFAAPDVPLTVNCEARFDVADADVMFVLDTTGSMACQPSQTSGCSPSVITYTRPDGTTGYYAQEVSGSKLSGLRTAVLNFYDTLDSNVDPSTNIRYGFVTYTSTVNSGFAIRDVSSDYLVKKWDYQSRYLIGDADNGSSSQSTQSITSDACTALAGRSPASGYSTNGTATITTTSYSSSNSRCTINSKPVKPSWRYGQKNWDVSQYVAGSTVADPTKITGATSKWQGCIEERRTSASSSFSQSSLPADLDPDLVPTNDDTRWRPMWPDVIYYRGTGTSAVNGTVDYAGNSSNPYGDSTTTNTLGDYTNMLLYNNISSGYVSCGKPVRRLAPMNRADVSAYVNASDFRAQGGTYHDTGMIWGTRMISPTGIFAGDTAAWPSKPAPNRYIVFMTDGDMAPNYDLYGMYGIERYDKRVTGGSSSVQTSNHNARFLAVCQAAKSRNITVFVVGFGQTLTNELTQCASPGQAYYASDNASLKAAFTKIANQVAMLRISK
jgi:Flp pilus assembly protein TadG